MRTDDSKMRLKKMAEAFESLMRQQDKQKAEVGIGTDDDLDLAADMLMDASDFLEEAADLIFQSAVILKGEGIEADRCPCCMVEVCCDEEF